MNFLDLPGTSTTPPANQMEPTLNDEVSQVIGQLGRFWGGLRRQVRQFDRRVRAAQPISIPRVSLRCRPPERISATLCYRRRRSWESSPVTLRYRSRHRRTQKRTLCTVTAPKTSHRLGPRRKRRHLLRRRHRVNGTFLPHPCSRVSNLPSHPTSCQPPRR
jgi:hypothetical protein